MDIASAKVLECTWLLCRYRGQYMYILSAATRYFVAARLPLPRRPHYSEVNKLMANHLALDLSHYATMCSAQYKPGGLIGQVANQTVFCMANFGN